jgi:hypothetical protein
MVINNKTIIPENLNKNSFLRKPYVPQFSKNKSLINNLFNANRMVTVKVK